MAKSVFNGVRISGVAGAVPATRVDNLSDHAFCPEEDRKKIIELTKVAGYRKAPAEMCASGSVPGGGRIAAVGPRAQRPGDRRHRVRHHDARLPRAVDRLPAAGPPEVRARSSLAYDINMGCSGYVVGLYNACSLIQGAGLKRVSAARRRHPDQALPRPGQERRLHSRRRWYGHAARGGPASRATSSSS